MQASTTTDPSATGAARGGGTCLARKRNRGGSPGSARRRLLGWPRRRQLCDARPSRARLAHPSRCRRPLDRPAGAARSDSPRSSRRSPSSRR